MRIVLAAMLVLATGLEAQGFCREYTPHVYGQGCAGTFGGVLDGGVHEPPFLDLRGSTTYGCPFQLVITNPPTLPPGYAFTSVLFVGLQPVRSPIWSGYTMGVRGCELYTFPLATRHYVAKTSFPLGVPWNPALIGLTVVFQSALYYYQPNTPFAHWEYSNGLELTVVN